MHYIQVRKVVFSMKAKETATGPINEKKKEVNKPAHQNSLYLDKSLLQKEKFHQYLAALVFGRKQKE